MNKPFNAKLSGRNEAIEWTIETSTFAGMTMIDKLTISDGGREIVMKLVTGSGGHVSSHSMFIKHGMGTTIDFSVDENGDDVQGPERIVDDKKLTLYALASVDDSGAMVSFTTMKGEQVIRVRRS